ncbi:hypothetical protein ACS5PU_09990 [Pedobacter sp. GSP4]|uniref:hypothetical protein n=1 Tax=Pedobacter sp. GSP4 TaxID=3453716 RepID=UPI003EE8903A
MKQLLILFIFIIFSGIQVAHAEFMNMGSAEIIVLLKTGLFTLSAIVGFIFLCLYLIRKSKSAQNEK